MGYSGTYDYNGADSLPIDVLNTSLSDSILTSIDSTLTDRLVPYIHAYSTRVKHHLKEVFHILAAFEAEMRPILESIALSSADWEGKEEEWQELLGEAGQFPEI